MQTKLKKISLYKEVAVCRLLLWKTTKTHLHLYIRAPRFEFIKYIHWWKNNNAKSSIHGWNRWNTPEQRECAHLDFLTTNRDDGDL